MYSERDKGNVCWQGGDDESVVGAGAAVFYRQCLRIVFSSGDIANPRVLPFPHLDKAGHALLFAAQFYCLAQAYLKSARRLPLRGLLGAALLWAVSSEVLQALFTTQRHGDMWDAVADMCGALLALRLATRFSAIKPIRAAKLP